MSENFTTYGLHETFLKSIKTLGWTMPTRIQRGAIPPLKEGRDALIQAPTGSGKTAAYLLPLLQRSRADVCIASAPVILVLTPTRELAVQVVSMARALLEPDLATQLDRIETKIAAAKKTRLENPDLPKEAIKMIHSECMALYGGVGIQGQTNALKNPVRVLAATPGRLLDLLSRKAVSLSNVKYFVIDEADEILKMGFEAEVRQVLEMMPSKRQTVLASATLGAATRELSQVALSRPAHLDIKAVPQDVSMKVPVHLWRVHPKNKLTLTEHLLNTISTGRVLIFANTKFHADRIAKMLRKSGFAAGAMHGDLSQAQRLRVLEKMESNKLHILVATDLAARGIDFQSITLVIHHDLPEHAEAWVHRNGRLVRGAQDKIEDAQVHAFCSGDEKMQLAQVEASLGKRLPERHDHPEYDRENDVDAKFRKPDLDVIKRRKLRHGKGGSDANWKRYEDGATPRKGDRPSRSRIKGLGKESSKNNNKKRP